MRQLVALGFASLLLPAVALAQAPRTFGELANVLVVILNNATAVLVVLGLVVYFYGVSTNILNFGEDGREKVKAYFFWGIIVLFVMVSIWGIVQILQETLLGGDTYSTILQGNSAPSQPQFQIPRYQQ